MDEPKSLLGSFTTGKVSGEKIDPADPRTWWAAYRVGQQDRLDVSAQMPDHVMQISGLPASVFYNNPRANAFAGAAVSAYYKLDAPGGGGDGYNIEIEAMGGKMIHNDVGMPTIDFREPLVSKPADLDKIKPPADWLSAGRVRFSWETARLTSEVSGAKTLGYCAPFSMAVGMRTYAKLIRDMKRDPAFAHAILDRIVDDVLPSYLKAYADYMGGADMAMGADAWAAYPNLSPELVEEWVVPYSQRLMQNCMKFGFPALPVASGDYCEENLSKFDKQILWKTFDAEIKTMMGQPVIFMTMGRWHEYPLEPVVEYLDQFKSKGIQASVTIGVNARLLRDGPPERIIDTVKRFIKAFAYDHKLTIFLANIPADAPADNIHAAVEAVHTYGKMPLAENLDDIHIEVPRRETFKEYVDQMTNGKGMKY